MAKKKLAEGRAVVLLDPSTLEPRTFLGGEHGDELPPWALEQCGEHCFYTEDEWAEKQQKAGAAGKTDAAVQHSADADAAKAAKAAEKAAAAEAKAAAEKEKAKSEVPPLSGAGSGVDAWRRYAEANDFEVPAEAKRDDIVDALKKAGVATEAAPAE